LYGRILTAKFPKRWSGVIEEGAVTFTCQPLVIGNGILDEGENKKQNSKGR
jgi:hypothetical protein